MDDALLVRRLERVRDLTRKRECLSERNRTFGDAVREGRSLHQLQHQRADAIGFLEAVNGSDVRVIQRGEDVSLTLESGEPLRVTREQVRQDLDGDLATEPRVVRAIDFAMPPAPSSATTSYDPRRVPAETGIDSEPHFPAVK